MSIGKLDITSHLNDHTYPRLLLQYPKLIHLLYGWNNLILQRNWAAKKILKIELGKIRTGHALDAGHGEGLHFFPYLQSHKNIHFTGIDKNENHLTFCKKYAEITDLHHVSFYCQKLETPFPIDQLDLIWSIGTLQYIQDDEVVLANIYNSLKAGGKFIVYVPINGKTILPFYSYFSKKTKHYDKSQNKKRIYSNAGIINKLKIAGLKIEKIHFTYGTLGIIGHEIYSILLMGISSKNGSSWICVPLLVLFFPIIFLLKKIDYIIDEKDGNGVLIITKKA